MNDQDIVLLWKRLRLYPLETIRHWLFQQSKQSELGISKGMVLYLGILIFFGPVAFLIAFAIDDYWPIYLVIGILTIPWPVFRIIAWLLVKTDPATKMRRMADARGRRKSLTLVVRHPNGYIPSEWIHFE